MTMAGFDIATQRLHNQGIVPTRLTTPGEVVRKLCAVQAQDYLAALWAIGLRARPLTTDVEVEQAIQAKEIVRTWPMRGTLHFVAAADVRWLLALLTPRVLAGAARRQQQLELDVAILSQTEALFTKALHGRPPLTRPQMMALLEQAGISTKEQRGYHLLWWAAQIGLICFGPRQGKQDTFVWLDDWLPPGPRLSRAEALAELARRYFTGHGPATLQDLMWWSGLPAAEARAGLEQVAAELASAVVDGQTYWFASPSASPSAAISPAYLLPAFDEYLLGYRDRSAVLDPAHATLIVPGSNGVFKPLLVVDGQVVGTWQRTRRQTKVVVEVQPFAALSPAHREAAAAAAEPYGRFLGLPVDVNSS